MTEAVKHIEYRQPVTGTTEDNPTYIAIGEEGGTVTAGGQDQLLVADLTSRQLLEGILIELKKINLRQEEAFEETIIDGDISC